MAMATPPTSFAVAAPVSTDKSAMAMATTLFFMWGFLTALNDILVPHLKNIFDLTYAEVMLIQFSSFRFLRASLSSGSATSEAWWPDF